MSSPYCYLGGHKHTDRHTDTHMHTHIQTHSHIHTDRHTDGKHQDQNKNTLSPPVVRSMDRMMRLTEASFTSMGCSLGREKSICHTRT